MHHFRIIKLIYPHPFKLFFIAKNMDFINVIFKKVGQNTETVSDMPSI